MKLRAVAKELVEAVARKAAGDRNYSSQEARNLRDGQNLGWNYALGAKQQGRETLRVLGFWTYPAGFVASTLGPK
jgi:hypothetical protein